MLARLRTERGMTLPEVLTSLTIGVVVTLAGFGLVETTMRQSGEVSARIDAVQRGRMAMDTITRQLRSQACLRTTNANNTIQRSVESGNGTSVTFYADMRDTSHMGTPTPTPAPGFVDGPERRMLEFIDDPDPKRAGKIVETRWLPTALGADGRWAYTGAPITREVLTSVDAIPGVPVFRYFAYDLGLAPPEPKKLLPEAAELSVSDAQKVAKIGIAYRAQPQHPRPDNRLSTTFQTEVFVRTVDPNDDTAELIQPCL
jgi:prepilin-type N-terminal cleavage/methylation domain-containing protein